VDLAPPPHLASGEYGIGSSRSVNGQRVWQPNPLTRMQRNKTMEKVVVSCQTLNLRGDERLADSLIVGTRNPAVS